jgi:hypothetical protein
VYDNQARNRQESTFQRGESILFYLLFELLLYRVLKNLFHFKGEQIKETKKGRMKEFRFALLEAVKLFVSDCKQDEFEKHKQLQVLKGYALKQVRFQFD